LSGRFVTSTRKWKNAVVREALTFDAIREMSPDEAAAYFVTRRSEGLTSSEEELLARWLGTDRAHQQMLDGADQAWNSLEGAEDNEILAAMRAHALAQRPRVAFDWARAAAVAAVLVVVIGGGLAIAPRLIPKPAGPGGRAVLASTATPYASAVGETKDITLPDGSRMTLDADSAAVGRFDAAGRSVELTRGRAFFAVVHNAARPFTVLAGDRRLVDVGTRFDVNLGPDALTVTLLDGRLAIGPAGGTATTTTLEPGQQLVRSEGRDEVRAVGGQAQDTAAWRTGLIRFDDQTLAEAAAVMNRYSHDQIVIRDPHVASIRVSGQFRAGQTGAFAETLAELYKLRAQHRADRIELLPAG
jgi:transmembrane sensor